MKVINWGDIYCRDCGRKLVEMPHNDKDLPQDEELFHHPQNTIGSVTYGWPKCPMEAKLVAVKVPLLDAREVPSE